MADFVPAGLNDAPHDECLLFIADQNLVGIRTEAVSEFMLLQYGNSRIVVKRSRAEADGLTRKV